ncbi:DnaJ homolog subfamily A member 2 [Chaetoceros tenuissimus]|uniref:DnaJ homolog subfamily A member 2 n=1 Tax=Chaetoceros tenuissimus TaxID=426638 RepID=A0AAD3CV26_9STRA|nr:DnaJ homolog subfamily A member 2 [Chaetoceros tenuissimus]
MFGGIPFEHFGAGGMPGMGGAPSGDVDTEKLYETLEISKDASEKDIKKAYRRLSRVHHPDKGGDEHKFKEIAAAYEILSDPEKRKMYDQYGLEGVENGSPSAGGEDLFSMFFGGGGRRGPRGPKKGPSINHPIKCSLDDIYNGKTVKLAVNRKVIVGEVKTCSACDGQGAKMEVRQIGPGMIQQMQRTCPDCKGQGNTAEQNSERKILEVHIEKGARDGQKISFKGMGDEIPGMEPGDINFIVQVRDHDVFKRQGADLLVQKELSLNQALCGFAFKLTHLDGRQIVIRSKPGEIIKPESTVRNKAMPYCKLIQNEGMPSIGNPFVKGNLYILFRVTFPEDGAFTPEQLKVLKEILPDPDMECDYEDDVEEVNMDSADLRQFGKGGAHGSGESAYDSDSDDGPQQVQCQQS